MCLSLILIVCLLEGNNCFDNFDNVIPHCITNNVNESLLQKVTDMERSWRLLIKWTRGKS